MYLLKKNMNNYRHLSKYDLERIVKRVLMEQSQPSITSSTTTIPVTATTTTTIPVTTTTTTINNTSDVTGSTKNEPVIDLGSDKNATTIEKKVEAVKTNESFESSLKNELNKMAFLFNYERGVVLSEQKVKKNLFESDGSPEEKPPYNAPIVKVIKLNNTEWRVFAFGTFPVNVTTGPLATTFMNAIVDEVYKDPILSDPQYKDRVTMTVAHVFGGASNYNSGPVKPDMDAIVKKDGIIGYRPAKITDESQYTGKYSTNTQLAKNRAINLFRILKTNLPRRPENKIKVTAKEEINGYNVNTGGVVDDDRDSKLYPIPGQHVNMALIIKIKPKLPTRVGSLECMKGLKITVASTWHSCDTAAFDVKLNGVALGEVDLGNSVVGTGKKDNLGRTRNLLSGSQTDGKPSGKRWRDFTINASNAASFLKSPDGSVKVSLKGKNSAHYEQRFGLSSLQSYAGKITTHADVPYVTIRKADGTIIYNQAPTPNTYAFGGSRKPCGSNDNPCEEFDLIKFNPCATNVIDGDLTGF